MKKNYYFLVLGITVLVFGSALVSAQEDDPFASITYPIAELGNCTDKNDCLDYCDNPDNMEACLNFAEANNLMPEEDIEMGKKMLASGQTQGPGGCRGVAECGAYCDDIVNIKECIAFAKENNLIPIDELEEAEKVIAALDRGVAPPPCSSKGECDRVCRTPANMRSCMIFAKEAGLMPPEEQAEAEKVLAAMEKGAVPPACGSKEECDDYCGQDEHFEECINFAEAAGFMSAEEVIMARKTGGKGPGGCRGKEVCESFCEDPQNGEACLNFAIENGFMSEEEGEQAKKMLASGIDIMKGGPGGCKGKEECESFCEDPANTEECVDFAVKAGMMLPEDAERMKRMGGGLMQGGPGGCKGEEECRAFCEDPSNGEECLNFAVQVGEMSPEEAEQARRGAGAMMQGGPGGCRGQECRTYCDDPSHNEECVNWAMESGMIPQEEAEKMNQMRQMIEQEGFKPGGEDGMMPPEDMMPLESFEPPEEFKDMTQPPSQEQMQQIEREMREQAEQQMQQQIQQQMQQQFTPPAGGTFQPSDGALQPPPQ